MSDLNGKTCLITGATSGIGYETALGLAKAGATVVMTAREKQRGKEVRAQLAAASDNSNVHVLTCDLSSLAAVRDLTLRFAVQFKQLHVLINNAGVWENSFQRSKDGIEMHLAVNHLAPFLLTLRLLPIIKASAPARIISLSSALHGQSQMRFDDLEYQQQFDALKSYGQSKLAAIYFTNKLARELAGSGVTANCLMPGFVKTDLFRHSNSSLRFMARILGITPEKGAKTSLYLASSPDVTNISGQYFEKCRPKKVVFFARDNQEAEDRLWEISLGYVGKYL